MNAGLKSQHRPTLPNAAQRCQTPSWSRKGRDPLHLPNDLMNSAVSSYTVNYIVKKPWEIDHNPSRLSLYGTTVHCMELWWKK